MLSTPVTRRKREQPTNGIRLRRYYLRKVPLGNDAPSLQDQRLEVGAAPSRQMVKAH